jgi:hypothetical protein
LNVLNAGVVVDGVTTVTAISSITYRLVPSFNQISTVCATVAALIELEHACTCILSMRTPLVLVAAITTAFKDAIEPTAVGARVVHAVAAAKEAFKQYGDAGNIGVVPAAIIKTQSKI